MKRLCDAAPVILLALTGFAILAAAVTTARHVAKYSEVQQPLVIRR